MVNIFHRLTRRALSSSSTSAESKPNDPNTRNSHDLHRTTSASSVKRIRHDVAAQEPVPRHLILISDTPEFDPEILRRFRAEAFQVQYLPFTCSDDFERDRRALENAVHEKEDELEEGERYAIVAYYLLSSHHLITSNTNPFPRLSALIAYYPISKYPKTTSKRYSNTETCVPACSDTETIFQPGPAATLLPIQIHIPEPENGCTFWPWITLSPSEGDVTYKKRHRCYVFKYPHSRASSNDGDSSCEGKYGSGIEDQKGRYTPERNPSSGLAWSRTLGCLRRAFGASSNWPVTAIETVWEEYWQCILAELDHGKEPQRSETSWSAMEIMSGRRDLQDEYGISIECAPTKAGGKLLTPTSIAVYSDSLLNDMHRLRSTESEIFLKRYIHSCGLASQHIHLLSRTVGSDRIVDEVRFSFRHTAEIPWLLPGISSTNREIEVNIVIVARFSADRIVHQKIYWDQADVLVQAGILDSALIPRVPTITD
ncbi:uncharacterized protein N7483_009021 [Penicillium malachiteum]|uniref:uncharacterized protein n=1 Tax=Penicillium malachiteum TaxID=1324776 RepID=UPI00254862BA|nr:uncharacterized protein N7483_009021 [Penicillium malachiteum]KAJ5721087.1 hypothetical protein N7483_009021 [Penicillium malachiteum]